MASISNSRSCPIDVFSPGNLGFHFGVRGGDNIVGKCVNSTARRCSQIGGSSDASDVQNIPICLKILLYNALTTW